MKKLLAAVVVAAILLGAWYYFGNREDMDIEVVKTTMRPDPSNATFDFEDGPVTLTDGKAEETIGGSSIPTTTTLSDSIVYGDVNDDGKNDAVALLIRNSGGSGVFVFIAVYVSGNVAYKGSNAVFVGDRISPQTVTVGNTGIITLTYLDRAPDEAMAAAPTISKTAQYVLRSGSLEER